MPIAITHRTAVLSTLAAAVLGLLASPAHAGSSDPDTSFNGTGIVQRELTTLKNDTASASALQADGRILLAGSAGMSSYNRDFGVIRHHADGTPDFGFGDGTGKVITGFNPGYDHVLGTVALPQGGLVAVGYTYVGNYPQFALAKYTAAGALDATFGGGTGKVTSNFATYGSIPRGIALQPDGKVVVVGEAYDAVSKNDFIVARYHVDGSLDTSFGSGGTRRIPMSGNANDAGFGIAIQPDGRIVVAGEYSAGANSGVALARLTVDGYLDASFGSSGKVLFVRTGLNSNGRAIAVQPDGNIVVVANAFIPTQNASLVQVLRFTTSGALDPAFNGGAGYYLHGFNGATPAVTSVELLPTGQVLVGGRVLIPTQNAYYFMTMRLTAAGVPDTTYNGYGYKFGDVASIGTLSIANSLSLLPDGKFVAAGVSSNRFAMVRYQGNALDSLPDAFDFASAANAAPSTLQISNVVTIAGLTPGALVPMTVSGGNVSINGAPASTVMGYVRNGDQVMVSHVSAAGSGVSTTTRLTIGGVHAANNRALVLGAPIVASFTSTTQ